ncbi:MAG: hypothetical protein ABI388_05805, partial [Bacteroidia bacterium]
MKKRNLFMSFTLMCGFLCLAFTFNNKGIYWLWADNKPVAISLVIATIIFGVFWLKSPKKLKHT